MLVILMVRIHRDAPKLAPPALAAVPFGGTQHLICPLCLVDASRIATAGYPSKMTPGDRTSYARVPQLQREPNAI